jgi:hypothetical protein
VPLELTGCDYVELQAKVPPGNVAPFIPDDFQLRVNPIDGTSLVVMGGARCAEARSGDDVGPAAFGWLLAVVLAPADPVLRGEGVGVFFYRLEHYVTADDVYRRVADEVGADRIEVSVLDTHVDHALTSLDLAAPGLAHRLDIPVSPVAGVEGVTDFAPVRWREFHAVEGGYAMLEATLDSDPTAGNGAATVQASGGAAETVYGTVNGGLGLQGPAFAIRDGFMAVLPDP